MRTLVLLQAAKAFFVAANTTMNLLDFPGDDFVRSFGVSQQLSAHSSAGNATTRKLLLYKIRLIQPSDTCDGLVRVLANLIAEFQETALLFEVRVVGRGEWCPPDWNGSPASHGNWSRLRQPAVEQKCSAQIPKRRHKSPGYSLRFAAFCCKAQRYPLGLIPSTFRKHFEK